MNELPNMSKTYGTLYDEELQLKNCSEETIKELISDFIQKRKDYKNERLISNRNK